MKKMVFLLPTTCKKMNLENSSWFSRKLQKTVFRLLRILPQIHRSVEITEDIKLDKCIVKIVVNLISFSNFPSKMQLHEPFLCENCFYDTYFFHENRPPLIHYRM